MGAVIFAGILFVAGLVTFLVAMFGMGKENTLRHQATDRYGRPAGEPRVETSPNYTRRVLLIVSPIVALLLPLAIIGLAGNNSVPTKSVGVVTSFGKVVGHPYGPGNHWMFPTKTLNVVTDTIQSDSFAQANDSSPDTYTNSGATGYCITVRLGGQQEGCADVQLQTQVEENAIPQLFANYSSYGPSLTQDIDQYVVKRTLTTVLNRKLGDYNPVQDVSATLAANTGSQFSQFDVALLNGLRSALGNQVKVFDVNLQYIHYDAATQSRINQISTQYASTQVAVQQEKTNVAISAANAALAKNNTLTPQVLQNECYTTTQEAVKAGYALPAGWNCAGSGSQSLLIGTK